VPSKDRPCLSSINKRFLLPYWSAFLVVDFGKVYMLVKIITLVFSDCLSGFDDTPLRDFMARHQVYKIKPEFFMKGGIPPYLVLTS